MSLRIPLKLILLPFLFVAMACDSGSKSPDDGTRDQTPSIDPPPSGDNGGTKLLPSAPASFKPLRELSSNEFCPALEAFLQTYGATRLPGTSLALLQEPVETCRLDSHQPNLNLHTTLVLMRGSSRLRIAINVILDYRQNAFTATTLLLDRLGEAPRPFRAGDSDRVFGDLTRLESELLSFAELRGAEFRIFGESASRAYEQVELQHKPGNRRYFTTSPRLRLELAGGKASILEVDPSYFRDAGFLRCDSLDCLEEGLSYEFIGNELVLFSKPYRGEDGSELRASEKLKLESFHLR